jgi:hypothetical protein
MFNFDRFRTNPDETYVKDFLEFFKQIDNKSGEEILTEYQTLINQVKFVILKNNRPESIPKKEQFQNHLVQLYKLVNQFEKKMEERGIEYTRDEVLGDYYSHR